jgi:hypothetical protein
LGIAQSFQNRADALKAELSGFDFVAESVKELNGVGVVH